MTRAVKMAFCWFFTPAGEGFVPDYADLHHSDPLQQMVQDGYQKPPVLTGHCRTYKTTFCGGSSSTRVKINILLDFYHRQKCKIFSLVRGQNFV